jgi:hypothetical protein
VRRAVPLAIVLALLLAGCGGAKGYSLTKTRACLAGKGVRIGGKLDFVASTATGGAFVAHLGDNFVAVVLGDNENDAKQIELAYHRFAFENVREGLPDVLRRDRNAVLLWHEHPKDADLALVEGCLK